MSWLARSIANSLKLDDDETDDNTTGNSDEKSKHPKHTDDDPSSPTSPSRGVKEDISELTKTLTRQFWGVASFLAPPPQVEEGSRSVNKEDDTNTATGIRSDIAEIGGKFRSGISQFSNNISVSEITKMASSFLQLTSGDEDEEVRIREGFKGVVGVTEEVVAFVRDVTMHPETCLAVERLVPRLTALRIELCPGHMSESYFWKIYFVLVHPRLDTQDAELLSTPQIMKARALLSQELKNQSAVKQIDLEKSSYPENASSRHEEPLTVPSPCISEISTSIVEPSSEMVKHPIESDERQIHDESASEENNADQVKDQNLKVASINVSVTKDEDDVDADDWLKEENSEIGGVHGKTISIENEEEVSFSDLEEDDVDVPVSYRKSSSSSDNSRNWVQIE